MDSICDRIARSIAQRGVLRTISMCAVTAGWKLLPNFRRVEALRREADAEFDRRYGVDTGGVFRPRKEEVLGENWALGGNYQAANPEEFERALRSVQIPIEQFTFIDMGSGKGRIILMASRLPFLKVVGVEYCHNLHRIACENAKRFPLQEQRCSNVELIESDAASFHFPAEPTLLFLNNPFAEPVMRRVAQNLVASHKSNPRRIVILYFWPNAAHVWEEQKVFHKLQESPAIFDTNPPVQPGRQGGEISLAE